jgi:hypothetical protein
MNPINIIRFLFTAGVVFTCTYRSTAAPGYGPFFPNERVRSVLLVEGQSQSQPDDRTDLHVVSLSENQHAKVTLKRRPRFTGAELHFMDGKDGRDFAWEVASEGSPVLVSVYSVCLNVDDVPDLIATSSYGGCGLWADLIQVVFLISDGDGGYVMHSHETLDWDANDIVDLNRDGRVGWVQTELQQVPGADGRGHSFWVQKLWRIEKTSMTEDTGFIPRRRAYRIL